MVGQVHAGETFGLVVAPDGTRPRVRAGDVLELPARSTVVLRQVPEGA